MFIFMILVLILVSVNCNNPGWNEQRLKAVELHC